MTTCQFRFPTLCFVVLMMWLMAAIAVRPAQAHPHAWIDVTVEVLFDGDGRAIGLRETWLFDEYYTVFALEGLGTDAAGKPSQAAIDDILRQNMENLKEYAYFTKVEFDGADVAFGPVTAMSSTLRGARLDMRFVVPFAAPLDLGKSPMTYAIYDPTYYIEMLHAETADAVRLVGAPPACTYRLVDPVPSLEAVALAAALDSTQRQAGDGLGAVFAERVTVRCP